MKRKGFFICIEGLDGCGKTTQAKLLVRKLCERGFDAFYTAEPTGGKIGKIIKKYYLHGEKRGSIIVEALLFAADRFEHVEKEIVPALNEGKLVVSDRYIYSSLAYQGAAGLDLKWIKELNKHAIPPNLAIFLDVKPKIVIQRLRRKKSVMEKLTIQRKVREVYEKLVKDGKLVRVDGNKSKEEVAKDILNLVLKALK